MDTEKLKRQIRILLGAEAPVKEDVQVTLTESNLIDGTNVSYDKLEIGSNFMIRTSANTVVPAPMGDYTLADGTIISVGETNLIVSVTPGSEVETPEVETPETEVETPEVETPEVPAEPSQEVKDLMDRVSALEEIINKMVEGQANMETELKRQIKEIGEQPSTEPIFLSKVEVKEPTIFEKRIEFLNKSKK